MHWCECSSVDEVWCNIVYVWIHLFQTNFLKASSPATFNNACITKLYKAIKETIQSYTVTNWKQWRNNTKTQRPSVLLFYSEFYIHCCDHQKHTTGIMVTPSGHYPCLPFWKYFCVNVAFLFCFVFLCGQSSDQIPKAVSHIFLLMKFA